MGINKQMKVTEIITISTRMKRDERYSAKITIYQCNILIIVLKY